MRMSGAMLASAPKSVFFRTGKRAKVRNMNSAKLQAQNKLRFLLRADWAGGSQNAEK